MPTLEAESVDAIVSDPPYGLSFMGKNWDKGVPGEAFWSEALRVAKAGSYLLAFGGTRTYHRLACSIEDAGWEIQDCLSWLYGSGFPKHKSKLKPAHEPIVMAWKRAPKATPLNIDACRIVASASDIATQRARTGGEMDADVGNAIYGQGWKRQPAGNDLGRWPANVLLDEEAAAVLDEQSGTLTSGDLAPGHKRGEGSTSWTGGGGVIRKAYGGDSGGASRFFYTAKASRSEREAGLEGFGRKATGMMQDDAYEWKGTPEHSPHRTPPAANHHPTVKPIAVMRWLCKLVTPPNGLILDPFTGSGTTGCAAVQEGFRFIGIEKEAEYAEIARARIAHWTPEPSLLDGAA